MCSQLRGRDVHPVTGAGIIQSMCCSPVETCLLAAPQLPTLATSGGLSWLLGGLRTWDDLPSRSEPSERLRCGRETWLKVADSVHRSTPRRDDGYEEHGEAGADFAMIGHLHEQRKQLLATMRQSESELGSVVLQLSSLESAGR